MPNMLKSLGYQLIAILLAVGLLSFCYGVYQGQKDQERCIAFGIKRGFVALINPDDHHCYLKVGNRYTPVLFPGK